MLPEPSFPANPADFVGRAHELESFEAALRHGLVTKRTPSFAVLGNWGIGKSSLLFKLADCCRQIDPPMLPAHLSISQDIGDYLRLAESLCDKLADALASSDSLTARLRTQARNWKFKQFKVGPITAERELPRLFLTSGSALLRHRLAEAWDHFIRPAQLAGAVFFLDDLQNLSLPFGDTALIIRDQFQAFAVEGLNFSVCFSAKPDYFSGSIASPSLPFASTANSFWHRSHLMKRSSTPKRCSKRKRMFNLLHSGSTRRHSAIRISSRSSAVNCSPVGTTLPRSFGPKFLPS